MSSNVLSVRKLVWLANHNQLSLVLRNQWSNEYDPYNGLRARITHSVLTSLTGFFALAMFCTFVYGVSLPVNSSLRDVFCGSSGVAFFLFLASLGSTLRYESSTYSARMNARQFQYDFCELLRYFNPNAGLIEIAKNIAQSNLETETLKDRAKSVLIEAAKVVETHKQAKVEKDYDPVESMARAEAEKDFEAKRTIFESFRLTYGHEYFFKEARRILAEEKEKAEMAATEIKAA